MTASTVQFLFDFGSPNAYLVHQVIPALESRAGLRVAYVPILLGGLFKLSGNRSPAEAFAGIPNKLDYERRERERFVQRHRIERFAMNPHFPVNTLALMRGAVAARQQGVFEPYVDAVFAGMWERGLPMADPAVIGQVLREAGLDAQALMEATQSPDVKNELMANTQSAFERGAFGSPTFFVGDEIYFGKDKLADVEAAATRTAP